jgi:nucleoid-associated protein YgaU
MIHGQAIVSAKKTAVAAARMVVLVGGLLAAAGWRWPLQAAIDPDESRSLSVLVAGESGPKSALRGALARPWGGGEVALPSVKHRIIETPSASAGWVGAPGFLVAPASAEEAPATREPAKAHDVGAEPSSDLGLIERVQDWLARANREFQTTVIRRLSTPIGGGDDAIARKLEEVKDQDAEAAAAAKNAEEALRAAQAKRAEDIRCQAETEAKRQAEAKQAEEAKRQEEAHKAAEEAKAKESTPPPATKPNEGAQLAEEMRKERERLEAEAERIEAQRKAAEAQRKAEEERRLQEERARTAARLAEERARVAAEAERNRTRTIVLTVEPIPAEELAPPAERATAREVSYAVARGPVVRRWVWRARSGRCWHAGRRITPPGRYIVRQGDSLWLISKRHYRAGWLYYRIYRANRSLIRDPDVIYPCQRIFLPRRRG